MKCGIVNCTQSDSRFLWRCHGTCKRVFHAACVGAQRNHEELLRTFMLPLCQDCQEQYTIELDLKALTASLRHIDENLGRTLESNHKLISNYKYLTSSHDEAIEAVEKSLQDFQINIKKLDTSCKNNAAEIKNTVTVLMNTPSAAVAEITKQITTTSAATATSIGQLKSGLAESHNMLASEVKMQLDKISNALLITRPNKNRPDLRNRSEEVHTANVSPPQKTLEEELAENPQIERNTASEHPQQQQQQQQQQQGQPPQQTTEQQQPDSISGAQQQKQQPKQTTASDTIADLRKLFAERRAKLSKLRAEASQKNDLSSSGWRFLGNKLCWRQDWSGYDMKLNSRQLQEKAADKAKRSRKRRKQQQIKPTNINSNSDHFNYGNNNKSKSTQQNEHNRSNESDKKLLATAKVQFAGPPSTTDHPIPGLSVPKFIQFRKGETINPYRTDNKAHHNNNESPAENTTASTHLESNSTPHWTPDPMRIPIVNLTQQSADGVRRVEKPATKEDHPILDPMRPPIVKLTEQSATGDRRYLKARLRDHKIMDTVRTYLSYLHDQPPTVCIRGITKISASVMLAAEGLPTDPNLLREIFLDVHEEHGFLRNDALADLQSYRAFLSSERIQRLQHAREAAQKFYSPPNFQRH